MYQATPEITLPVVAPKPAFDPGPADEQVRADLLAGAQWLEDHEWVKGAFFESTRPHWWSRPVRRYCAVGALNAAAGRDPSNMGHPRLQAALERFDYFHNYDGLMDYNDNHAPDKATVIAKMREAAQ